MLFMIIKSLPNFFLLLKAELGLWFRPGNLVYTVQQVGQLSTFVAYDLKKFK